MEKGNAHDYVQNVNIDPRPLVRRHMLRLFRIGNHPPARWDRCRSAVPT